MGILENGIERAAAFCAGMITLTYGSSPDTSGSAIALRNLLNARSYRIGRIGRGISAMP